MAIKTERCKACDRTFGKATGDSDKCPYCGLDYQTGTRYGQDVIDASNGLIAIAKERGISVAALVADVTDPRTCPHTEDDDVLFTTSDGAKGCVACGWEG